MKYKPLNMFAKQTEELKKLIEEHPDYKIIVVVNSDVCSGDEYFWWYAPSLRFGVGEILDCEQEVNDEKIYVDRDDFEEDVRFMFESNEEYENLSEEEFEKLIQDELAKYEPYWRDVIQIRADV